MSWGSTAKRRATLFSMATPICSISLFINVFLLLRSLSEGYAAKENEATKSYLHIVEVNSLLPPTACNHSSKASKSLSLEVVHRHGPCNGILNQERATDAPSNIEILLRDQYRVDSIHARLPQSWQSSQRSRLHCRSRLGASIGAADYVVTVGLGTPKKDFTLIFDTGSDITWTQFASEGTKTCSSSACLYQVQYGDGSYSIGITATETLTLSATDVFKNFLFGCGQQNQGLFGGAAGLLGLAPMVTSVSVEKVSKSVKFTPLSADFDSTPFYGLDITELSVGGRKLSIDASAFSAGTVIDSGTVISRLPPTAYSELSSEFKKLMTELSLRQVGGVEMDIDVSGILYPANGSKKFCLAFAGNEDDGDTSIFGNVQQRTYQVVYDGVKGRVGFAPGGCS
ncbi:hypothetical protein OIU84_000096 [Salix udensis]|uniref:Peptidase A1 domain-containing protein n=1 Tax=Salix udensis TaxID=889485 RepID=A0AAD6PLY1_9ROSI|nr:hypothetical protein OIU84_000096 [Salix udensis]